jgi:NAD(P)-dependent dehydrogenase (short-subunit alcohol dehydrogenase family)
LIFRIAPINVEIIVADFESTDTKYASEIADIVSRNVKDAKLVALFHNAGTVGDLAKRSDELNSVEDWHKYLQINLVSTILLNNTVYSTVCNQVRAKELEFLVIDITSLLAIKAFPSFTQVSF